MVLFYALFIKLMERKLPNEILSTLERWFDISVTFVKWNGHVSHFPLYWLAYVREACSLLFFSQFCRQCRYWCRLLLFLCVYQCFLILFCFFSCLLIVLCLVK